jgi:hypothetical protein
MGIMNFVVENWWMVIIAILVLAIVGWVLCGMTGLGVESTPEYEEAVRLLRSIDKHMSTRVWDDVVDTAHGLVEDRLVALLRIRKENGPNKEDPAVKAGITDILATLREIRKSAGSGIEPDPQAVVDILRRVEECTERVDGTLEVYRTPEVADEDEDGNEE